MSRSRKKWPQWSYRSGVVKREKQSASRRLRCRVKQELRLGLPETKRVSFKDPWLLFDKHTTPQRVKRHGNYQCYRK